MVNVESADTKRLNDLRRAIDTACIVAVIDAQGYIVFINDNFCKVSGYSSGELIGEKYNIFKTDYHPKEFSNNLWKTISSGKVFRAEFKEKSKQEQIYWVDTSIIPFLNERGKPFQYIVISRDITELKTTERELVQWKQRYEAATVAARQVFYDYNLITDEIVWGGAYKETLGYDAKELKSNTKSWINLIHPDDSDAYQATYQLALDNKKYFHHEYRVQHKNQSYIFVQEDGRFLYGEDDAAERMIGFIVDISERKELEKIRNELPKQIIEAQEKEKERIAMDIHDDLGQSLMGTKMLITSYLQEAEFKHPEVQKFGQEILEQINYCIEKARKVSYGLVPPHLNLLGLSASVKDFIKRVDNQSNLKIIFKSKNIGNLKIEGEEVNVYRIVQEAMNNVLKHAKATEVNILMNKTKDKLNIKIQDNGNGFHKNNMKKSALFARGLGLSVMNERAKLLGGKVDIDSKPGQGTSVIVDIPLKGPANGKS